MIDVHCHLNFHKFEADYDDVIKRAFAKGITKIINVGTSIESSQQAVRLAEEYDNLYAIVGIHPHHADKVEINGNWLNQLEDMGKHPKVIGIGEIGMDYFSYQSNGIVAPKLQRKVFEAQIELAYKQKLPLQIHHRQVGQELIDILTYYKNSLQSVPGMFHCFAGSKDFLRQVLELGFYIGFDGNSTYQGLAKGETVELSEIANLTPLERIVCETDSPYLTPNPHRGKRNEPQYVILVGKFISEIKRVSYTTVVEQTTANVHRIFTKLK